MDGILALMILIWGMLVYKVDGEVTTSLRQIKHIDFGGCLNYKLFNKIIEDTRARNMLQEFEIINLSGKMV